MKEIHCSMLELRHFHLVLAIAEEGTLVAASRRLHLTPSALSHQLRNAEESLGVVLFERRHRRLRPTPAGEQLIASARAVLAEVTRAETSARSPVRRRILRLSTGCYTAYPWLAPALVRLAGSDAGLEVQVVLEATSRPLEALLAGELDLALTSEEPRHPRLVDVPLFEDELRLLVARSHPLAAREFVQPEDLGPERLLTYDLPREQLEVFQRFLWPAGVEPARTERVPLTETTLALVTAGFGVATLATWALPGSRREFRSLRLGPRGLLRTWRAVHLRQAPDTPTLRKLVELIGYELGRLERAGRLSVVRRPGRRRGARAA
jgi:LysR family transcriptional regulator, regulator for metE and metH